MRVYVYGSPGAPPATMGDMVFAALRRMPNVEAYAFMGHGDGRLHGFRDLALDIESGVESDWTPPAPFTLWTSARRKSWQQKARRAERVFHTDFHDGDHLNAMGIKSRWLPPAADTLLWTMPAERETTADIGFLGNVWMPDRVQFLDEMFKAFPKFLWRDNSYWETAPRDLAMAKVAINHCATGSVNRRVFEAMAMGHCLVTPWTHELSVLGIVEGTHAWTYETTEEAIAKVHIALSHDDWRAEMGRAARALVLANHTYFHRAYGLIGRPVPSQQELEAMMRVHPEDTYSEEDRRRRMFIPVTA